ncbi:MAG: hypothetical protein GX221_04865 [Candidatus Riflebacteria bacterium]|nr:hypothetical protein [Candidatus Riflebacteria bacterium]
MSTLNVPMLVPVLDLTSPSKTSPLEMLISVFVFLSKKIVFVFPPYFITALTLMLLPVFLVLVYSMLRVSSGVALASLAILTMPSITVSPSSFTVTSSEPPLKVYSAFISCSCLVVTFALEF